MGFRPSSCTFDHVSEAPEVSMLPYCSFCVFSMSQADVPLIYRSACLPLIRQVLLGSVTSSNMVMYVWCAAEATGAAGADADGRVWLREGRCSREGVVRQGAAKRLQNGGRLLRAVSGRSNEVNRALTRSTDSDFKRKH